MKLHESGYEGKLIVGIDGGLSGGIAAVGMDGQLIYTSEMPTVGVKREKVPARTSIRTIARDRRIEVVWMEEPASRPGNSAWAAMRFGYVCGLVEGIFSGCGNPVFTIPSATWKKAMGLTSDKELSLQRARGALA